MDRLTQEIESVRATVGRHFPIYDTRVRADVIALYIRVDRASLGEKFEALRKEMMDHGYIPMIVQEGGEQIILVQRRFTRRYVRPWVNLIMLGVTVITTVLAGGLLWSGYRNLVPEDASLGDQLALAFTPAVLPFGAGLFALPLLTILGTHEMGHFLTARHHRVAASLPFFLPAPPPIGTLGAVISMRDPMPNKRALVEIGIAGPLAGLAVAVPVTLLGLFLNAQSPGVIIRNYGGSEGIQSPLLYQLLESLIPPGRGVVHPMAFAGWVGLFVTALNLLPAGQLDGGHVARALLGDRAKYLSYAAIGALLTLAFWPAGVLGFSGYFGWALIGLIILLLGPRHPPPLDDLSPLGTRGKALGAVALLVIAVCFVPVPFSTIPPHVGVRLSVDGAPTSSSSFDIHNLSTGVFHNITLRVNNTGNILLRLNISLGGGASNLTGQGWVLALVGPKSTIPSGWVNVTLNQSEEAIISLVLKPSGSPPGTGPFSVTVLARERRGSYQNSLVLNLYRR